MATATALVAATGLALDFGWVPRPRDLMTPRFLHTATLLPSGKVLVVGGFSFDSDKTLLTTELYNPMSGTWQKLASSASGGNFIPQRSSRMAMSS